MSLPHNPSQQPHQTTQTELTIPSPVVSIIPIPKHPSFLFRIFFSPRACAVPFRPSWVRKGVPSRRGVSFRQLLFGGGRRRTISVRCRLVFCCCWWWRCLGGSRRNRGPSEVSVE
ncbi:hypothetical protein JTE90_007405 [Oedothorax gibbosus]|uniref:Uncharacterized protein n=1 Tax=Oedothorax gibbosus TaxID=931172 RepID=A0AAV6UI77_9ARAC|nr:hypothetical protein JTE90_007405 [Oedothorax gibbosus]